MTSAGKIMAPHNPPYHIVNALSHKHLGPFSSELDCVLARTIDVFGLGWLTAEVMDKDQFDAHLDRKVEDANPK